MVKPYGTMDSVIEALERGAILLLDEIDLASNKILCLQSILEGTGVFLKKIGRTVDQIQDSTSLPPQILKVRVQTTEDLLELTCSMRPSLKDSQLPSEQSYPKPSVEQKILDKIALNLGVKDTEFCKRLVDWGDIIRKTFYDGGIEEIISTRRLVHIVRAYSIFNDKMKAIQVCVNRFDDETKQAFLELYDKVDADVDLDKLEDKMYD